MTSLSKRGALPLGNGDEVVSVIYRQTDAVCFTKQGRAFLVAMSQTQQAPAWNVTPVEFVTQGVST